MTGDESAGARTEFGDEVRRIWDRNAEWWDDRIGDGNAYQIELIEPAQERLIRIESGTTILDIACGAGRFSRRMAELGGHVVAFDFSERFIARAKQRTPAEMTNVEYHVADATDEAELLKFGAQRFDGAVATIALMDIADVGPLFRALARLLKPGGWFVFSVLHPCFQGAQRRLFTEMDDDGEGRITFRSGVAIMQYLTPRAHLGEGIMGQPEPHYYFTRPLSVLFAAGFESGFVLDGLIESAFEPGRGDGRSVTSKNMPEIPVILAARMRLT
ncbi:MAG: class I SAM-dependent methyltransferase [Verrucomicrobia bacterium]|nr:class I SAM-dependent methyltransferase [Verrucomicrobiota bacterium]